MTFPNKTEKSIKSLAEKLNAVPLNKELSQTRALIDKAVKNDSAQANALAWYLLEHNMVTVRSLNFFEALLRGGGVDAVTEAHAVVLAEALTRVPEGAEWSLLPGWTWSLDQLVYRAYPLAPAAFLERAARWLPGTRLGLALVRGRRGGALEPAARVAVLRALADSQAHAYGIATNTAMPFFRDGVEVKHELTSVEAVKVVALLFGSASEWDAAFLAATKRNEWGLITNVLPVLESMSLPELVALFEDREKRYLRVFGDSSDANDTVVGLFKKRADPPDALERAKQALPALAQALG